MCSRPCSSRIASEEEISGRNWGSGLGNAMHGPGGPAAAAAAAAGAGAGGERD